MFIDSFIHVSEYNCMAPIWQEYSQNGLNRIKRVSDHIMTCSAAVFVVLYSQQGIPTKRSDPP